MKAQATQTFDFCAREAMQIFGGLAYTRGGQGEKVTPASIFSSSTTAHIFPANFSVQIFEVKYFLTNKFLHQFFKEYFAIFTMIFPLNF